MPTLPDSVAARQGAEQQRRRWGRREALEVRRSQEAVFRIWLAGMACTALPLALSGTPALPFPPWSLWAVALALMAVVTLFAASSTRRNARHLAHALDTDGAVLPARATEGGAWRNPSVRTLGYASVLFLALATVYTTISAVLVAQVNWPAAQAWLPAVAGALCVTLGALLGWSPQQIEPEPAKELARSNDDGAQPTLRTPVSDAAPAGTHASAPPSGLALRAPTKPLLSRPAFPHAAMLTLGAATPAGERSALEPRTLRAGSLGEAIGALFPDGATLLPALLTPIAPRSRPSARPLPTAIAPATEARAASRPPEQRKQSLTEPKRIVRHHDHASDSRSSPWASPPPPPSAEQERDTERPPSRRSVLPSAPVGRESQFPTTPAPAEALANEASALDEQDYPVHIPRSPKAPTFEIPGALPAPERREAGPDNFRPTLPAIPSARAAALASPSAEFVERPTRPADAVLAADEPPSREQFEVVARTPAVPPPPPDDSAELEEFGPAEDPPATGRASDGPAQTTSPAETTAPPLREFDSSQPPTPVESEIRWVEVGERTPASSAFDREPTSEVVPNDQSGDLDEPTAPDSIAVTPRKQAESR
jgi:hypothetical protein